MNQFLSWLKDIGPSGHVTYGNAIALATLLTAVAALLYVILTSGKLLRRDEGTDEMKRISRFFTFSFRTLIIFAL